MDSKAWDSKAVIMVAVICIIVFIVSSISHKKVSYRVEQKNLEKLEKACIRAEIMRESVNI